MSEAMSHFKISKRVNTAARIPPIVVVPGLFGGGPSQAGLHRGSCYGAGRLKQSVAPWRLGHAPTISQYC